MKKASILILVTLSLSLCITQEPTESEPLPESISLQELNVSQPPFGIHTNVRLYNHLPKLGASWTFIGVFWGSVEPEQDVWDFEEADRIVQEAQSQGVNLIVKIRTGECWATRDKKESDLKSSSPPENLEDYSEFVSTLVNRYKDAVHYWAIENEMNTPRFWNGTLDEYNQVIETAYKTIKDADPQAQVLDSGMASMTYGTCIAREMYEKGEVDKAIKFCNDYYRRRDLSVSSEEDLKEILYSEEAERVHAVMMDHFTNPYYDVYQLHFYEDYSLLDDVIAFVKTHLKEEKQIFAVEMGYAWRDDATYDEKAHAEGTVKLMVSLLAEGVPVQIYLPLIDLNPDEHEEWKGIVSPDKERRPALTGFGLTARLLEEREFTGEIESNVYWYEFEDVSVLWSEEETAIDISAEGSIAVVSIYGEKKIVSPGEPLTVGPSPQFIVKVGYALQYEIGENVEIVEFPSYDGELVEGFLRKPEGTPPFPAVILVHGGVSSRESAARMAENIGNLFVQRGYVALAVHYRAGPIGLQDVEDTLSGIQYVKGLDFVDPERIGVYGGSHGGYIALMCAWRSDVKAVVEAAGFCNLGHMMERLSTEKNKWVDEMIEFYGGYPDEVPEVYMDYSPCGHVVEFTAAVFIIHGKMDTTVPVEHAYELQELLDLHSQPYGIYLSETGEHGFYHRKTEEAEKVWKLIFEFFDTYLKS